MAISKNSGESSASTEEPQPPSHHEVFSASRAGHLDSRLRRFIYRPDHLAER